MIFNMWVPQWSNFIVYILFAKSLDQLIDSETWGAIFIFIVININIVIGAIGKMLLKIFF